MNVELFLTELKVIKFLEGRNVEGLDFGVSFETWVQKEIENEREVDLSEEQKILGAQINDVDMKIHGSFQAPKKGQLKGYLG